MPRIARVDGFEDACDQAELLCGSLRRDCRPGDSFETLDRREVALHQLWGWTGVA